VNYASFLAEIWPEGVRRVDLSRCRVIKWIIAPLHGNLPNLSNNPHIYLNIIYCILYIVYSCISIDELLPTHLRIAEGISWTDEGAIASGWINTMRVLSKNEFIKDMSKLKFQLCNDTETEEFDENKYVFDPICPKMINLHDKAREKLAVSDLVRDYRFIFLVNIIPKYNSYLLK